MDIFTPEKRREIMRSVKNTNTNIELLLRKSLYKNGHRFRVKNSLFGKPDIVFPKEKIAIFCDGDFWHGKNYKKEKKNYKPFWIHKIGLNRKRDIKVNKMLRKEGWTVIRLWKTQILKDPSACVDEIEKSIRSI